MSDKIKHVMYGGRKNLCCSKIVLKDAALNSDMTWYADDASPFEMLNAIKDIIIDCNGSPIHITADLFHKVVFELHCNPTMVDRVIDKVGKLLTKYPNTRIYLPDIMMVPLFVDLSSTILIASQKLARFNEKNGWPRYGLFKAGLLSTKRGIKVSPGMWIKDELLKDKTRYVYFVKKYHFHRLGTNQPAPGTISMTVPSRMPKPSLTLVSNSTQANKVPMDGPPAEPPTLEGPQEISKGEETTHQETVEIVEEEEPGLSAHGSPASIDLLESSIEIVEELGSSSLGPLTPGEELLLSASSPKAPPSPPTPSEEEPSSSSTNESTHTLRSLRKAWVSYGKKMGIYELESTKIKMKVIKQVSKALKHKRDSGDSE